MAMKGQNVKMWAGDDQDILFTISGYDDLVGTYATWYLARSPSATRILTKSGSINGLVVTVRVDAADSASLNGRYHHELRITDAFGHISTVGTGRLYVKPTTKP